MVGVRNKKVVDTYFSRVIVFLIMYLLLTCDCVHVRGLHESCPTLTVVQKLCNFQCSKLDKFDRKRSLIKFHPQCVYHVPKEVFFVHTPLVVCDFMCLSY